MSHRVLSLIFAGLAFVSGASAGQAGGGPKPQAAAQSATDTAPTTDTAEPVVQQPPRPPAPAASAVPPPAAAVDPGAPLPAPAPLPAHADPAPAIPAPSAPTIDIAALVAPVTQAIAAIDALEKSVDAVRTSEADLSQKRGDTDALIGDVDTAADALRPQTDATRVQLDKLGPPPKDKEPKDSPQVAAERARLSQTLSTLEGAAKSAELVKVRARQLGTKIQELRRGLFAENLLRRTKSPILPDVWLQVGTDIGPAASQLVSVIASWQGLILSRWTAAVGVFGAAALAFLAFKITAARTIAHLMPANVGAQPGYMTRASAACLAAPLLAVPGIAAAAIIYFGLQAADLIFWRADALAEDTLQGVMIVLVVVALATAILQPRRPAWRLMDLSNRAARSLWRTVAGFALVYSADLILNQTIRMLALPLPFNVALSFLTSLAFSALLLRAASTRFMPAATMVGAGRDDQPASPPARVSRLAPRWLKLPLLIVALAILATSIAGYVALGRFAAGQVVITGSAVVLAMLLHLGIRTTQAAIGSRETGIGNWLSRTANFDESQSLLIGRVLSAVLHVVLAVALIPGLLLAWGFSIADVMAGLKSAMFGFEIGRYRISLAQILAALALFAAIILATRVLQRWLDSSVLRPDRIDPGIANSIHQGVGYAGSGLAVLAGVSFGGIDITNIALVAGALSVGIGFGLQSIVNNFVSGLILLVERPIKVGDWIVVKGGGEGYVRGISVRSTEIETFDRASLIVPNSELISNVVTNWTHRNSLGRIVIKVAASYKSDPGHVLAVLTDVAKASSTIMQQPPPLVTLDNLGGDGLEFSIRVLVSDVTRALAVQTELRTAVFRAFRDNGIEFPTPERDLYLRDLDGVKVMIARILEERAREQAGLQPAADRQAADRSAPS